MLSRVGRRVSVGETVGECLQIQGVTRKEFLVFCGKMAALLGLGATGIPRIVSALPAARRPSVIWLELQWCTGCLEAMLRSANPTIGEMILDLVSLDYQTTLMAATGNQVEAALRKSMEDQYGQYLLLVTGSIPLKDEGVYTTVAGRTAKEILVEAAQGAKAVIALGACAHWGSVQAASPNPTGAVGVDEIVRDRPVVNIAGCPPIPEVVTATLVHYLSFGRAPDLDRDGRPLFAYGLRIHDQCPRHMHFDAGHFVEEFDDERARRGFCLYKVGCKGPLTYSPCPIFLWNTRTSWPVGAGHPCLGCTERYFWDVMTPFYQRSLGVKGFGFEHTADIIGAALAAGAAAGVAAHAIATGVHQIRQRRKERQEELPEVETAEVRDPEPEEPPEDEETENGGDESRR